ncbi:MAG TPA: DMT family transporter [Acidimicrobiia bacterium]|nr:DMT family transporter [Acidimicrobiia bacterium]
MALGTRTRLDRRQTGVLLAAATALISGVSVFVNGYGVRAWTEISDPTTYTTLKNTGAALILLVVMIIGARVRGAGESDGRLGKHKVGLILIAVVGGSIPFVLFFEGLARATSGDAAFIHKTLVVWVAILAVTILRERVGLPHLAALVLLVWGQAALSGGVGAIAPGSGEWMILLATLLWAVETVIAKRLLSAVPSLALGVTRMAGGALVLILFGVWRGAFSGLTGVTTEHVMWIAVTAVTLAGYVGTWYAALARAQAVDVTAVLVAGALITGLLETGLRGAALPSGTGLVLIATGVLLVIAAGWRRPALVR